MRPAPEGSEIRQRTMRVTYERAGACQARNNSAYGIYIFIYVSKILLNAKYLGRLGHDARWLRRAAEQFERTFSRDESEVDQSNGDD